jgi:threonine dehydrogenase-like Zn-dependent dehydrogenase
MKAVQIDKNYTKFATAVVANKIKGHGNSLSSLPLSLVDLPELKLPDDSWTFIYPIMSGICGSDLKTIEAKSSRQLEHSVTFPFVMGHETVAIRADNLKMVVIESVLSCGSLGIEYCNFCQNSNIDLCQHQMYSDIAPGLQIGYTKDIPGGWSEFSMAQTDHLIEVPDDIQEEDAVMVEPMACAIHGVLKIDPTALKTFNSKPLVSVIGAGTLGLCVTAALKYLYKDKITVLTLAKHPYQQSLAKSLGADNLADLNNYLNKVRSLSGSLMTGPTLTYGSDIVIDCIGSKDSIHQAIFSTKPGGQIILVGMPSKTLLDLSLLWQRQITITGAYTYGTETASILKAKPKRTFDLAVDAVTKLKLGRLVSAKYSLENYKVAVEHAMNAGSRDSTKIVFKNNKEVLMKKLQRRVQ